MRVPTVRYTIGALASKTGISAHTIRAWEKRYSAVTPERTDSNQRLYGESELERLILLRRATQSGHSIGQVATLSADELRRLTAEPSFVTERRPQASDASDFIAAGIHSLERLDGDALEANLVRCAALMGVTTMIEEVLLPLLDTIGNRWHEGSMRISQEHLSTAVIRTYLDRVRRSMIPQDGAPRIVVTTPINQHHELGAMIVAISAATLGWHVTYLGPNLPAADVAEAVHRSRAQALCLSIVYPADDPALGPELRRLRQDLGRAFPILIGGRAAAAYHEVLDDIGAMVISQLGDVPAALWACSF